MAEILDGRATSKFILDEVQRDVSTLKTQRGVVPGLAVILVGDDPASRTYVTSKSKTCRKLGMNSILDELPASTTTECLISRIRELNADPEVHGILIQLPLPPHIDSDRVLMSVDPAKDVDGLHPENVGLLCSGRPRFIPCTPYGVCELLARSGVTVQGKGVVVLGRSNLVGRPLSIMLSSKGRFGDATVTVCHSKTPDIGTISRRAEVLIVAIGRRRFVTSDMVKPGAVVVDVGIHPADVPGARLCGDVDFTSVASVASRITPVPGGVGPMTIAMLMRNTANAALLATSLLVP